jgi:hypothetical protein
LLDQDGEPVVDVTDDYDYNLEANEAETYVPPARVDSVQPAHIYDDIDGEEEQPEDQEQQDQLE